MKKNCGQNFLSCAFLFCILLLVSCGSVREKIEKEKIPDTTVLPEKKAAVLTSTAASVKPAENKICDCVESKVEYSYSTGFGVTVSENGEIENDSLYKR
ncbi:MAG: hypothetical protein IAF38_16000, partial [Bacteroidia bacterium]|nr:hypothetical protein [Bacteroidia bacterium]